MTKDKKNGKMIKLSVYFHTSEGGIELPPKVAFKKGIVQIPTNHRHKIRTSDVGPVYFSKQQGTLMDAIKKCLQLSGVKLVDESKVKDYKKALKEDFFDEEMEI